MTLRFSTPILARLLCDAVEALECDIERARASLVRATALVGQTLVSAPDSRWQRESQA